ncbi:MAG: type VI secretion system protein TssA [Deltaproteobacteria bacterium]|nr:type VI secretion system protein TssA [Deltaproteobacteria bacterium]
MRHTIDIDAILTPIPGENPAGEDLRYAPIYDEIKEARRADDILNRGDWDREIKTSDWEKVISLSQKTLVEKTKDLQIGAWLTEALTKTEGFEGLSTGLTILTGFLNHFWEHVYPEIDEDDLDYRVGPLEFLNNNLWLIIKETPLTDPGTTPGYSWVKWQESRQVGSEKDTKNQYGDIDDAKKKARNGKIAEGKLPAEEFDDAVASSSKAFYIELENIVNSCLAGFKAFDEIVDAKFGNQAPRWTELKKAIEECAFFVSRTLKKKKELDPDPEPISAPEKDAESETGPEGAPAAAREKDNPGPGASVSASMAATSVIPVQFPANIANDSDAVEQAIWKDALQTLQASGLNQALTKLLNASCSAASIRQQNRYRLLIARLSLKAQRPDLARPVIEGLHALIEQLNLEQWESPIWIAEILDTYYQCLTSDGASEADNKKANFELLPRICTKDVTKAIGYK